MQALRFCQPSTWVRMCIAKQKKTDTHAERERDIGTKQTLLPVFCLHFTLSAIHIPLFLAQGAMGEIYIAIVKLETNTSFEAKERKMGKKENERKENKLKHKHKHSYNWKSVLRQIVVYSYNTHITYTTIMVNIVLAPFSCLCTIFLTQCLVAVSFSLSSFSRCLKLTKQHH